MKIELEVDGGQLGTTIQEILASLTPEGRERVVCDVMRAWLLDPTDADKKRFLESMSGRDSWGSSDRIKAYRSPRDLMFEVMRDEIATTAKKLVTDLVTTDADLQKKFEQVREIVVAQFPSMVQAAMTAWFAGNMESIAASLQAAQSHMYKWANFGAEIAEKLGLPSPSPNRNSDY